MSPLENVRSAPPTAGTDLPAWSPWRVVVGFGVVSLTGDMVYEGARSVYGPLLAALGASAVTVGLISGAGEAVALLFRLLSGPLADRTRRYWTLTITGYALTAVGVPLLAVTPWLGGTGLTVAAVLILSERLGKAVRSPAKSALLADAAGQVGMGRGLGAHKALDQIGAFAGPLLVAAVVAGAGALWPALAVLAVPGAITMVLLVVVRARSRRPPDGAPQPGSGPQPGSEPQPDAAAFGRVALPRRFHWFSVAMALCTAGLVTFGLIGYHLAASDLVPTAGVPLLYAAAMAVGAVAALGTGLAYDRVGPRVLLALPLMVALVPALAFAAGLPVIVAGVLVWGAAVGVQDSTVKALVADLVPRPRRATAYGIFAAVQGAGALVGGAAAGTLYETSTTALVAVVAGTQVVAFIAMAGLLVRSAPHR